MKTSELHGAALDWAVAKCEGYADDSDNHPTDLCFSIDWELGGPIIEREGISILYRRNLCCYWATDSECPEDDEASGQTGFSILAAAMRCYVASRLGDDVTIPNEIMEAA